MTTVPIEAIFPISSLFPTKFIYSLQSALYRAPLLEQMHHIAVYLRYSCNMKPNHFARRDKNLHFQTAHKCKCSRKRENRKQKVVKMKKHNSITLHQSMKISSKAPSLSFYLWHRLKLLFQFINIKSQRCLRICKFRSQIIHPLIQGLLLSIVHAPPFFNFVLHVQFTKLFSSDSVLAIGQDLIL